MEIAVIGNSGRNAGVGVAADLAMAGHSVRFSCWNEGELDLEPILRRGGLELRGDADQLISRRLGLSKPRVITTGLADAVAGAEILFLDIEPSEVEAKISMLVPHLESGQVVHINNHGYWAALRSWPILSAAGRKDVVITESTVPISTVQYADGVVTAKWLRRRFQAAAFPAAHSSAALARLKSAYPSVQAAVNVLDTGFANLNMLVHPAMALLNVGWFDRAQAERDKVCFYGTGNTAHTGRLAAAHDIERRPVCEAFRVPWTSVCDYLRSYYDVQGADYCELIQGCSYYRSLSPHAPEIWQRWLSIDIPQAHVPFVELAELAGVAVPLHRAFIAIFSVLLGRDFQSEGVTLQRLGLRGASPRDVQNYVLEGI